MTTTTETSATAFSEAASQLDLFCRGMTQRLAMIAVLSVLLIAFATCVDIVLRNFFGTSLYGLNEIVIILVSVAVSSCIPLGMAQRIALTITLLDDFIPEAVLRWLKLVGAMAFALFFALLSWRLLETAMQMARFNQTTVLTEIPKAPFFYAVSFMLAMAALVQCVVVVNMAIQATRATARHAWVPLSIILALYAGTGLILTGVISTDIFMVLVPDNPLVFAALMFMMLWVAILLTIPLGAALGLIGLIGVIATLGLDPSLKAMGSETISFLGRDAMSVLPLFLLMGTFCAVAGVGGDLYRLAYAILGQLRGGLAQATIAACAGFGALTGSAIATQMTIGRIAIPEMRARGYSSELTAGSIAAGGTLGALIPPSNALIFYAVLTESSVGSLFVAALLPGLLGTLLYMMSVTVWCWLHPEDGARNKSSSVYEVYRALSTCWAPLLLLSVVLGGIYGGFFTDLEAGSVGAAGAFLIAIARGKITRATFWNVMGEATQTMALIFSLLFGVIMLSFFFGISQVPEAFVDWIQGLNLTPLGVIITLIICYLIMGTAMDSWVMMVITIPIFTPLVVNLGYDPIWWGIMTVICMEAGQISPPFGINIFLINALDPNMKLSRVYIGVLPFFVSTVIKIILLTAFPAIVMFLPNSM